ncbi:MAG: hybrid sensor histidine kinase/response regulator [Methylococcaceae bacterium]|nr:MAG: hybrid sensor histidine kinase/response regulator [Methylococcaceae bacterium]
MDLDPEIVQLLLGVFEVELGEQTDLITDGLLKLENEADKDVRHGLFDAIFRAAHNIKGAARGVEIPQITELAHHIESIFSGLRQSHGDIEPQTLRLCFLALDRMRAVMASVRSGAASAPEVGDIVAQLERVPEERNSQPPAAAAEPIAEIIDKKHAPGPEAVRVTVARLEHVAALIEELQVFSLEMDGLLGKAQAVEEGLQALHKTAAVPELAALAKEVRKDLLLRSRKQQQLLDELQAETRNLRMVPIASVTRALQRIVWELAQKLNKNVRLTIIGDELEMDRAVLEGLRTPLVHLVNNAIDHGIEAPAVRLKHNKPETACIAIQVQSDNGRILISVQDDGCGIDPAAITQAALRKKIITPEQAAELQPEEALDLVFAPGFSSREIITDVSGRGVGLDVVRTNVAALKGEVWLESTPGVGTTFYLRVPLTVVTDRGLIVRCGGALFAVPTALVQQVMLLDRRQVLEVESTHALLWQGKTVALRDLAALLGFEHGQDKLQATLNLVILAKGLRQLALVVEDVVGESELVIKPLLPPLEAVRHVIGAAFTSQGLMLVLNAGDLVDTAYRSGTVRIGGLEEASAGRQTEILIVDDSITTRTLEQNILTAHGYRVSVATDGEEAWDMIRQKAFDLVITDVEMPNMNGFELTELIKSNDKYAAMPVVIVTSLARDSEKQRGIEVGADGYIVKGQFEAKVLLDIVRQLT